MAIWTFHIDRFERQYEKTFFKDPLFGADLIEIIHRRVQVFLYYRYTTEIEEVDLGALTKFGYLQKRIERGEWLTITPVLVERPSLK